MKKILIIEDDDLLRDGVIELLESEGYKVIDAENGRIGLDIARKQIPDLIICDVMMPEMNGFDVLDVLQQDYETASIPFIFLTALTEKEDMRHGMELGADDFLSKPFKASELFKAVKARLCKQDIIAAKSEEKLNELRLNIATILPHELRTPLNGILASAQLLMEYFGDMDQEEVQQLHENIYISASRLNRLIQNYLYFVELELLKEDKKRLEKFRRLSVLYNPSATLSDTFKNTGLQFKHTAGVTIKIEDKPIMIFEDHFKKICEEIADNAFKFSNPDASIEITNTYTDKFFQLCVKNYGRGLSPNQIKKIGAYVQFDRNVYEQQGSGLGLVIVDRLLGIYKGKMAIESSEDNFTLVKINIPIASDEHINELRSF